MTKIKLCGLTRRSDIEEVNELRPDYAGFVFAPSSRRYITPKQAEALIAGMDPCVTAVGVFVNERPEVVAGMLNRGCIGIAQLHGREDAEYIRRLRALTDKTLIQAFRMETAQDVAAAQNSPADYVLLDSGSGGTGTVFEWELLRDLERPYFLAGGLSSCNVGKALAGLRPYAVDVSSGIETDGVKDPRKMREFVRAVRL